VFEDKNGKPASRDTLLARLKDHIFTVMGRYKGRVHGWDVVNEAFEGDGSYRDTPWKRIIGEDYIQFAFEYAREADSTAELYYNDFNMPDKGRRDAVVKMVNDLKAKGVKVDGIGMQGHYVLDYPTLKDLEDAIVAFGGTGAKVMFTEMEVTLLPFPDDYIGADVDTSFDHRKEFDPYTEGLPDSVNMMQASRYADFFKIFIKHSDIISRVTLWGVNDAQSWKNNWPIPGRTDYPLLFDRNNKPKAAYDSIINCAKAMQTEL
jgi:endo-1,4-beta-xylanase